MPLTNPPTYPVSTLQYFFGQALAGVAGRDAPGNSVAVVTEALRIAEEAEKQFAAHLAKQGITP